MEVLAKSRYFQLALFGLCYEAVIDVAKTRSNFSNPPFTLDKDVSILFLDVEAITIVAYRSNARIFTLADLTFVQHLEYNVSEAPDFQRSVDLYK